MDDQPRCENPMCGHVLVIQRGHRRRQYCNDVCKVTAFRARQAAAEQARIEAERLTRLASERNELRRRWGDLEDESLDLLQQMRKELGTTWTDKIAAALATEREHGRMDTIEERDILINEIMLAGERLYFPALLLENDMLEPGCDAWSTLCSYSSVEQLRLAHDAIHLKQLAAQGRHRLAKLIPKEQKG